MAIEVFNRYEKKFLVSAVKCAVILSSLFKYTGLALNSLFKI
jgi:hypothetical protein